MSETKFDESAGSPLVGWDHRTRRNAYGGTWEVHHPDGTKHMLFLWMHKYLGFYAIQKWGHAVAKQCMFRRLEKPSAKPSRFLHVSEKAQAEASPDEP